MLRRVVARRLIRPRRHRRWRLKVVCFLKLVRQPIRERGRSMKRDARERCVYGWLFVPGRICCSSVKTQASSSSSRRASCASPPGDSEKVANKQLEAEQKRARKKQEFISFLHERFRLVTCDLTNELCHYSLHDVDRLLLRAFITTGRERFVDEFFAKLRSWKRYKDTEMNRDELLEILEGLEGMVRSSLLRWCSSSRDLWQHAPKTAPDSSP